MITKTAGFFSINNDRQAKLLVGRVNAGDKLSKNEKKLVSQIGEMPTTNTYDRERFWASPMGRVAKSGITAATILGSMYAVRKANQLAPKLLSPGGLETYHKMLSKVTPKTIEELGKVPKTDLDRTMGKVLSFGAAALPVSAELAKPTIDRMRYPVMMMAQAKKDKKTDSGVDAQLRIQLKKNANATVDMIVDNVDVLNNVPVGNPKKKEELMEALKKIESGSKAQVVMDKIAGLLSTN